jgi:hypothetical protein
MHPLTEVQIGNYKSMVLTQIVYLLFAGKTPDRVPNCFQGLGLNYIPLVGKLI